MESYGAEVGPLVGLVGTADARLNTLVLVGTPKQINVAEAYLKQIDLRKRQAAVKLNLECNSRMIPLLIQASHRKLAIRLL